MKKIAALVLALIMTLSLVCIASAEAHAYALTAVTDLEGNVLELEELPVGVLLFNDETFEFALNLADTEVEGVLEVGEAVDETTLILTAAIGDETLTFSYYDDTDTFALIDEGEGLVYVFTALAAE